jgi:hypothetical protein
MLYVVETLPFGEMAIIGSRNLSRRTAPLARRLKIDDLHAQLAPVDRYCLTG